MRSARLNEICQINPPTPIALSSTDDCSFVPMEAVDDYLGQIVRRYVRPFSEIENGSAVFAENDVIVAKITPSMQKGKCAVARNLRNGIGFGSNEFHVLRASNQVLPEWLYFFWRLPATRRQAEQCMTGSAGQKRVPARYVESLSIPLPTFTEQKRIAGVLERADRLRRLRRFALGIADDFLPAVFLELFSEAGAKGRQLPEVKLGELCDEVLDFPHSTPVYAPTRTPYACIRSSDIQAGFLDFTSTKYVGRSEYEKRIERGKPTRGDVFYCRAGARFGNAARVLDGANVCLGQRMMLFRANPAVALSEYIWGFLTSRNAYRQANRVLDGSASPHVKVAEIVSFRVSVPPLSLQKRFAELVHRHGRLRQVRHEALRQAEHLFQTLLYRTFTTGL